MSQLFLFRDDPPKERHWIIRGITYQKGGISKEERLARKRLRNAKRTREQRDRDNQKARARQTSEQRERRNESDRRRRKLRGPSTPEQREQRNERDRRRRRGEGKRARDDILLIRKAWNDAYRLRVDEIKAKRWPLLEALREERRKAYTYTPGRDVVVDLSIEHPEALKEEWRNGITSLSIKARNGCWIWQGHIGNKGYGLFSINRIPTSAHRISFVAFGRGLIRKKMETHHLCENKLCVNPFHVEPVTSKEHHQLHPQYGRKGKPNDNELAWERDYVRRIKRRRIKSHDDD